MPNPTTAAPVASLQQFMSLLIVPVRRTLAITLVSPTQPLSPSCRRSMQRLRLARSLAFDSHAYWHLCVSASCSAFHSHASGPFEPPLTAPAIRILVIAIVTPLLAAPSTRTRAVTFVSPMTASSIRMLVFTFRLHLTIVAGIVKFRDGRCRRRHPRDCGLEIRADVGRPGREKAG